MDHESLARVDRPDSVNVDLVRNRIAEYDTAAVILSGQRMYSQPQMTAPGSPTPRDPNGR
jgi:hypothetical protein